MIMKLVRLHVIRILAQAMISLREHLGKAIGR